MTPDPKMIHTVGIIARPRREDISRVVPPLIAWLRAHDAKVVCDTETGACIGALAGETLRREDLPGCADLLIVLGGDGTLLSAARLAGTRKVPILAVNLGGLGFLTTVSLDEFYAILEEIFSNQYRISDWLMVDADIAFAQARFRDSAPEGQRIPGAVEGVASLSIAVDHLGPWFGALQYRYFGPRPLIEDNSVRSKSTATLNGRIGYKVSPKLQFELEGFNLSNRKTSAIDYYYSSRLPGEPAAGVADVHFHPIESRTFRLSMILNF